MAGSLPDEVLERLSVCGPARLSCASRGEPVVMDAHVAPLHGQLYALIASRPRSVDALLDSARATLRVEGRDEDWSIRVDGRALAGRSAAADARRSELAYWLPDGARPAEWTAVRLHPESVEYIRGRGATRTRAAGPVPGGAAPPWVTRWTRLSTEGTLVFYLVLALVDWLSAFVLFEPGVGQIVALVTMLVCGGTLLASVTLWGAGNVLVRWREGLEADEVAGTLLDAWVSLTELRSAARVCAAVAASFAPVLLVFHGVRHAMRRGDASPQQR